MNDLQIRAERADQPEVIALLDALDRYLGTLYAPEDNYILDVQALLAPEIRFLVARDGGAAVGCGAVRRMPGEAQTGGRPYGEIKRMYVDPDRRGRGIAARLLQALEAALRADGIAQSLLETGAEQIEAVRLYERQGYLRRGPFGGYPDNGLSLFYEKSLAP
jgi:putative acetyltransferase